MHGTKKHKIVIYYCYIGTSRNYVRVTHPSGSTGYRRITLVEEEVGVVRQNV